LLLPVGPQDLRDEDVQFLRAQNGSTGQGRRSALRGGIAGLVESNLRPLGIGGGLRPLAMASLHTEAEKPVLLRETVRCVLRRARWVRCCFLSRGLLS